MRRLDQNSHRYAGRLLCPDSDCLPIANTALKYERCRAGELSTATSERRVSVIDSGSEPRRAIARRNGFEPADKLIRRNRRRRSGSWMEIREKRACRSARLDSRTYTTRTCAPRARRGEMKTRELYRLRSPLMTVSSSFVAAGASSKPRSFSFARKRRNSYFSEDWRISSILQSTEKFLTLL